MFAMLKKWWANLWAPVSEEPAETRIIRTEASPTMLAFSACRTDAGCVRPHNEDNFYCSELPTDGDIEEKGFLAIVADGMGGHAAGEVASQIAVQVAGEEYHAAGIDADIPQTLLNALTLANQEIYEQGQTQLHQKGMGTTCTALAIFDGKAYYAHVGDSRLYCLRNGELTQLTTDQTWVQEMVRQGKMTQKEARVHEDKNILLQAMGTKPKVSIDVVKEGIPVEPYDRYLLCSDGLHDMIDDEKIYELAAGSSLEAAAEALVESAKAAGGLDNITVLLIEILPEQQSEAVEPETKDHKIHTLS